MCMQKGELLRIGTIFLGLLFVVLRITNTNNNQSKQKRMNRLILALIISCGLTACSNNGSKKRASIDVEQTQPQEQKDRAEVMHFHSKQRCATCMAIENNANEEVEAEFADDLENGTHDVSPVGIYEQKEKEIAPKEEVRG